MIKNSITARYLNRTSEHASILMCSEWEQYASLCSMSCMMDGEYHVATQNRFYPDMSEVTKNIIAEA